MSFDRLVVYIRKLNHGKDLDLPAHATMGSAGVDLYAAVDDKVEIKPLERKLIPTGIQIALPANFEAQIRPRSGLALKHGITVLNTPGTIDSDYRGEIGVVLINLGESPFIVERGMRIAQMVIAPVVHIAWKSVDIFLEDESPDQNHTFPKRASGGFGSTGL